MKQASTLFLKATLVGMGAAALAFCMFAIPAISKGVGVEFPELAHLKYPILIGGYLTAIPFFVALFQAFQLLRYIDKKTAFSAVSAAALKRIKYCGIAMGVLYAVGMPMVVQIAEADDAPGLVVFGMLIVAAPVVVAVFAAILQKLTQHAIAIQTENDLMV